MLICQNNMQERNEKMKNKLFFALLMLLLVLTLGLDPMALGPSVEVEKVSQYQGKAIDVSISVANAPIAGAVFDVAFDNNVLVPVSVTNGTLDEEALVGSNIDGLASAEGITSVKTVWLYSKAADGKNIAATGGVLYTIRFEVKETAPLGVSNLTITYSEGNVANSAFEDVAVGLLNGSVNVNELPTADKPVADKADGKYIP